MKLLAGIGALGVVGGGLYATDALTAGTVYDKPYHQAYADLATMPLLPVSGAADNPNGSMVVEQGAGTISWRISVGRMEVGHFTARLSPVGDNRTRVLIDFAATPQISGPNPVLTSQLMTDFARLAMVEQIDARLENRAPDIREMQWSMARHIQANPELVKDFGMAVNEQFRQVDEMLRADDSGAWAEMIRDIEANHAPPPKLSDATKPAITFDNQ